MNVMFPVLLSQQPRVPPEIPAVPNPEPDIQPAKIPNPEIPEPPPDVGNPLGPGGPEIIPDTSPPEVPLPTPEDL